MEAYLFKITDDIVGFLRLFFSDNFMISICAIQSNLPEYNFENIFTLVRPFLAKFYKN